MPVQKYLTGKTISPRIFLVFFVALSLALMAASVSHAQTIQPHITVDGSLKTLGGSGPQEFTGSDVAITQEMGVTHGGNLFHSFGKFNIPTDHSVTFSGDPGIANILSRVTGGAVSSIDGTLASTIENANLFLLNPAGLVFGPNAKLDVKGAFYVSNADFVQLGQSDVFYANLEKNSILTAAPPEAFGFLNANSSKTASTSSAAILVEGLEVKNEHSVSLISRDAMAREEIVDSITISDGTLQSPNGRVTLVSIGATQVPAIDQVIVDINTLKIQGQTEQGALIQEPVQLGATTLSQGALIDTSGDSGGSIIIRGGRLTIDGAEIGGEIGGETKGTAEGMSNDSTRVAVDVETKSIDIRNGGGVSVGTNSSLKGGDIVLNAAEGIKVREDGFVFTYTEGTGDAGNIVMNASEIDVRDSSQITSQTDPFSPFDLITTGNTGNIQLMANRLVVDNADISTRTFTSGNAGDIDVTMPEGEVSISNLARISSTASVGSGDAGNINVTALAGKVNISSESAINTEKNFESNGDSGNIYVTAKGGDVFINDGGDIFTTIDGTTNGGSIQIAADNLELVGAPRKFTKVGTDNNGVNKAGGVSITLTGNLDIRGGAFIDVISRTQANAEELKIVAKNVSITGGGQVTTESQSTGIGGNLTVKAENLLVSNQGIINSRARSTGNAGNINIDISENILLTNGASVTTESLSSENGAGNAGKIDIMAHDTIRIEDSTVTTRAQNAVAGDINFKAENLIHVINSNIISEVPEGSGSAGRINLDPQFIVVQNSLIDSTANLGAGGDVTFIADSAIFIDPFSTIDTSSEFGGSGTVDIRAPIQNLNEAIAQLPEEILKVSGLFAARCAAQKDGKFSSFFKGGDGTPPGVTGFLSSPLSFPSFASEGITTTASRLGIIVDRQNDAKWKLLNTTHSIDLTQGCSSVSQSHS